MNIQYFEPDSLFFIVIALLILYPILLLVGVITSKTNLIGKIIYGISAFLYAYVIWYSYSLGIYLDEMSDPAQDEVIFGSIGYFHLILLAFPYIFLTMGFTFKQHTRS